MDSVGRARPFRVGGAGGGGQLYRSSLTRVEDLVDSIYIKPEDERRSTLNNAVLQIEQCNNLDELTVGRIQEVLVSLEAQSTSSARKLSSTVRRSLSTVGRKLTGSRGDKPEDKPKIDKALNLMAKQSVIKAISLCESAGDIEKVKGLITSLQDQFGRKAPEKKIKVNRLIVDPETKFTNCSTCNGTGNDLLIRNANHHIHFN